MVTIGHKILSSWGAGIETDTDDCESSAKGERSETYPLQFNELGDGGENGTEQKIALQWQELGITPNEIYAIFMQWPELVKVVREWRNLPNDLTTRIFQYCSLR